MEFTGELGPPRVVGLTAFDGPIGIGPSYAILPQQSFSSTTQVTDHAMKAQAESPCVSSCTRRTGAQSCEGS